VTASRGPSISVCVIVRDAVETIGRALASVRPFVDEVCIYDTGSVDGTLELLDELAGQPGAPIVVERGEWRDDFAWAREQSFAMASPEIEWLLWLDADDVVEIRSNLRGLLRLAGDVDVIFAAKILAAAGRGGNPDARILRRSARFEWRGVVHEHVVFEDQWARFAIANPWALRWVHWRLEGYERSLARNVRILEAEERRARAAGEPVEPHVLVKLGWSLAAVNPRRAIGYLSDYMKATDGRWSKERIDALGMLGDCHALIGDMTSAHRYSRWSDEELAGWREAYANGEVAGLRLSTPAVWQQADAAFAATRPSTLGRNDPCWCGSRLKLKRCCVVAAPDPPLVRLADVQAEAA